MDDAVALVRVWAGARAGDTETVEQICCRRPAGAGGAVERHFAGQAGHDGGDFLAWLRQDPLDVLVDDAGRRSRNVNRLLDKSVAEVGDDSAAGADDCGESGVCAVWEHVLQGCWGEPHTWSRGGWCGRCSGWSTTAC